MSRKIAAMTAALLVSSCTEPLPPQAEQPPLAEVATSNTALEFDLEPEELSAKMALAKGGDSEAALRVADYFQLSEQSPEQSLPWLVMAADRGNVRAMQNLMYYYGSGMYPGTDCSQAVKWWGRAISQASESELEEFGIRDQMAEFTSDDGACKGVSPNSLLRRASQSLRD